MSSWMSWQWMVRAAVAALIAAALAMPAAADVDKVLKALNETPSVKGTEEHKSYKVLFDGYLALSEPPMAVSEEFNLTTIYPKMSQWAAVSGWAESNAGMAQAILKCKDKVLVGLPYGIAGVDAKYKDKGLVADVGHGGSLRANNFDYLQAVDVIAAYSTAETYRLMEAGKAQEGLDLAVAFANVLRQFCDREFLQEKLYCIELLSAHLSNMRDVFYRYRDTITAEQFGDISGWEIPFLKPDRSRLFMPEGDRIVAEALIREVFDASTGSPDEDKFTETFAEIQSKNAPLTRFGAARRWRMIASVHDGLEGSINRLKLVYDDWWRRWRVEQYDEILAIETEFDRMNPVRYAAVLYSIQNVGILFSVRNQLVVEVNGTAVAAGLCAYHRTHGTYPDQVEKTYSQPSRKRSDTDPYDRNLQQHFHPFQYRLLSERQSVDTPAGRVWVESGEGLLYSVGQDHEDDLAKQHTDDGIEGDIVIWPPIKSLLRKEAP